MFADEVNQQINSKKSPSGFARLIDVALGLTFAGMIVYAIIKNL